MPPLSDSLPLLAALGFVAYALRLALSRPPSPHRPENGSIPGPNAWLAPAVLGAAFLAWSLAAVIVEGPTGFWTEHTRNLWGNQIWFDLLLAAGTALAFLVPEARRLGMRPLPWVIAVACTGCIGLMAMLARMLFLKARPAAAVPG